MTIDQIQRAKVLFLNNINRLDNNDIFSIIASSKDIDGGLNFEEEILYYSIHEGNWICKRVIENTIQPAYGKTITTDREKNIKAITDETLLEILNNNPDACKTFSDFVVSFAEEGK